MSINTISLPDKLVTPWCALPSYSTTGSSSGFLNIENAGPAATWQIRCEGNSTDPTHNALNFRSNPGGGQVDAMTISPAGDVEIAGAVTADTVAAASYASNNAYVVNGARVFIENNFSAAPFTTSLSGTPVTQTSLVLGQDATSHKLQIVMNCYSSTGALVGAYYFNPA